jgi:hypothetical protein
MVGFTIGCITGGGVVFGLCLVWAMRAMDPRGSSSARGYEKSVKDYEEIPDDDVRPGYEMS